MKVCLLNDSFPPVIDGVANVVMNYGRILQTEGLADVMVATPRYPDTDYSGYPYKVLPYQSFDTTKLVKGYRAGNPWDIREVRDMAEFGPDIIHSHCPVSSNVLARLVRNRTGAPIIFTYHTKFDVDINKAVKAKIIRNEAIGALVSNIAASDEVWVVSHGAGENLRSMGYTGEYRVVSNGVDFPKGRVPQEKVNEVVAGLDLPEGLPVFLFVGRIVTYKGIPLILDALSLLEKKGMDFRMIFVGSGPDEAQVKEQARNLGLIENPNGDKCFFVGAVHDREVLRAYNTRADLFLFPSTYDTNGIVVREAAACGLASVLLEGSCAAEGITHDRNGYIIQESAEAMCELLYEAGKDLDHLHQVGQHAMDEIYISWEESVHDAYARYEEILEMKRDGAFMTRREVAAQEFEELSKQLYADTERMFEMPRRMYEGMRENAEELSETFRERTSEMKEKVHEISQEVKDLWQQ